MLRPYYCDPSLALILFWKISCDNLEILSFYVVDKHYFNPRDDLEISTFSRGRQTRIYFF